jgi:signal transduction histidine kinase/DNA-binding response OmpR family regulator
MNPCDAISQLTPRSAGTGSEPAKHKEAINILIVDDEPKNLTVLDTILDNPGYRLVRATSAEEALLALVVEEFALLILDIRMPGMTGFELAQLIKERKKTARVPIIYLTAYYNEDQHVLEGYATGAVDYLHKPVNPVILRSKVAIFAELYRKGRELSTANQALLTEVNERRRAEEQLRELNETLDQRVSERTEALRDSEERLARAQQAGHVGAWDFNLLTGAASWTEEAWRLFCRKPGECSASYETWLACVHPDDRAGALAAFEAARKTGQYHDEFRVLDLDGGVRWTEVRGECAFDQTGTPLRMSGTVLDITDRKQTEQALREVDRRKDEFLATLAHELRNPLAPVRNAVEILHLKGPAIPELQWARDVIDRQVRHLARLIDDLMDLSRINRGNIELKREQILLAKVVQGAVEASRPLIEECGHELTVELPASPVVVDADITRLSQVYWNLLNNAAKYMTRGGRIDLRTELQGSDVMVSVKDAGIGISADKLSTIFEMFSQVETALSRSQGGLGVGLYVVKRLVEMHGGEIEARSEGAGKGSEFVVRLPIVVAQNLTRQTSNDNTAALISRLRILVVDDNEDAASSSAILLKIMGNHVRTASDGEQAVQAAGQFHPHVVLLDIGLPKMNGYDVARAIRQQPWGSNVILIAVTGWGQEADKRMSEQAGFDHHMVKPVDPRAVMKYLAEVDVLKARANKSS